MSPYIISEIPCVIRDARIWSNSGRVVAIIRQAMDTHRAGNGAGPLTRKTSVSGVNEGILLEVSDRESECSLIGEVNIPIFRGGEI